MSSETSKNSVAVAYLARGKDKNWLKMLKRFAKSYSEKEAGAPHKMCVLFKGFESDADLEMAREIFRNIDYTPFHLDDDKLDIGAYMDWAPLVEADYICVFNSASHILADRWLQKLSLNLTPENVGMVGGTASFESLFDYNNEFPPFPNPHLRSTAFMISREDFLEYTKGMVIRDKDDAFHFESGPKSLSNFVLTSGRKLCLVGRNGRGYGVEHWVASNTFRLGLQENLLVGDNQTENFLNLRWKEKREFAVRSWGDYLGFHTPVKVEMVQSHLSKVWKNFEGIQ